MIEDKRAILKKEQEDKAKVPSPFEAISALGYKMKGEGGIWVKDQKEYVIRIKWNSTDMKFDLDIKPYVNMNREQTAVHLLNRIMDEHGIGDPLLEKDINDFLNGQQKRD